MVLHSGVSVSFLWSCVSALKSAAIFNYARQGNASRGTGRVDVPDCDLR